MTCYKKELPDARARKPGFPREKERDLENFEGGAYRSETVFETDL